MTTVRDSFIDLEKRRRQLEDNLKELEGLLKHWQTWEAEYEGLKEEIQALGTSPSRKHVQAVADEYEGTLLNAKEISQIVRDDKSNDRDAKSIIGLLSRRIDYVQDNVKSVQKRYDDAESKLEKINVVMRPEATDEEGLPLTEITEELDEDDNVISHILQKPGDIAPQILEALKKQGVPDLSASSLASTSTSSAGEPKDLAQGVISEPSIQEVAVDNDKSGEQEDTSRSRSSSLKKKVSFADSTKAPADDQKREAKTVHEDVVEQLANEGLISEPIADPVIPANETPEQAALRQEMLQYNMDDIGRIVAEINLDEQTDDEPYSDDDYANDSEVEEDEDQWGRSSARVINEDYRKEMLELERKLNAKSLVNAGPNGQDSIIEEEVGVPEPPPAVPKRESSSSTRKGVRFAQELDVQEAPTPQSSAQPKAPVSDAPKEQPMADTIIERSAPQLVEQETTTKPKKISAFKSARAGRDGTKDTSQAPKKKADVVGNGPLAGMPSSRLMNAVEKQNRAFASIPADVYKPSVVPEGPPDRTLADKLVERPLSETTNSVTEPDELDPALMRQQIATEYHNIRTRMIQRNGGFTQPQDEERDPEADEGQPRVSRFKAARLAKVAK